jgi:hypothetical protein
MRFGALSEERGRSVSESLALLRYPASTLPLFDLVDRALPAPDPEVPEYVGSTCSL